VDQSQIPDSPICGTIRDVTVISLPSGSWWSWEISSFDGSRLVLAAGADLTYHHELELILVDVSFMQVPTAFEHPVFREPTDDEFESVRRCVGEEPPSVIAFDVEAEWGSGTLPCLLAAEWFDVRQGRFEPAPA
jgi:hypothetical protein